MKPNELILLAIACICSVLSLLVSLTYMNTTKASVTLLEQITDELILNGQDVKSVIERQKIDWATEYRLGLIKKQAVEQELEVLRFRHEGMSETDKDQITEEEQ